MYSSQYSAFIYPSNVSENQGRSLACCNSTRFCQQNCNFDVAKKKLHAICKIFLKINVFARKKLNSVMLNDPRKDATH